MIKIIENGSLFESECQTLVNTVNCIGVMGKGIALEFKNRYPSMFKEYRILCNQKKLDIGKLWIYKAQDKWILNFPTKYDWRMPSRNEYLERGLQKFLDTYKSKGIASIAFPLLGASNGGIDPEVSLGIMKSYLDKCDIPVEIYLNKKR